MSGIDLLDIAYKAALASVEEAQELGIKVEISETRAKNDPQIVAQYSGPNSLPPEKWIHVTFFVENESQADLVNILTHRMNSLGFLFDTGGTKGQRDWELDWSFHLGEAGDIERMQALNETEEIIRNEIEKERQVH